MMIDCFASSNTFHFLPYIMVTQAMTASDEDVHNIVMFGWMFFGVVVYL